MDRLKVKAFLYALLAYIPIGVVGVFCVLIGYLILKYLPKNFFTYIIGGNTLIFGTLLFMVSLVEPLLKLTYYGEAINSPFAFKPINVSIHPKEKAIGVKISNQPYIKEISNDIIENECKILGRPYCIKVARKSGLNIDESGKIISLGDGSFSDLEKLVKSYVDAFGKPALYTAEVVLSKYPDIKFKSLYQPL